MALYRIAGLYVEMTPQYETLAERSRAYLTNDVGRPDIDLTAGKDCIKRFCDKYPYLTPAQAEYIFSGSTFYTALLDKGGILLHSSAVELDGNAYLFTAKSGTGKSTHTSLWLKVFGDRAHIINDDKPAIMFDGGTPTVYGTPWSGKTDQNLNIAVPLKGIACLYRGETNHISPMPSAEALKFLMEQTVRPAYKLDELLGALDKLLTSTPVYRFECNISDEAVSVSYNAMKGN